KKLEFVLKDVPGTRSVFAERASGGDEVDFSLNRPALARFGLSVDDAQEIILSVVGGNRVATTIEGRARIGVNVRYPSETRESLRNLETVQVHSKTGVDIPLSQIADVQTAQGPAMIRDENGLLTGYVYIDLSDSDVGGYVARAREAVEKQLT